jgi:hemerythrin-like domain-containing protein
MTSSPAAASALRIIRDEHRTLTSVIGSLQLLVHDAAMAAAPDFELFTVILDYIEMFPDRFHHPKEDEHLFTRMRRRSATAGEMLDGLEAEHRRGEEQTRTLRQLLARWRLRGPAAAKVFAGAVDEYATFHWEHMRKEEDVVMPLAETVLTDEDWQAIADAFGANTDLRLGTPDRQDLQALFRLILNRAPAPIGLAQAGEERPGSITT